MADPLPPHLRQEQVQMMEWLAQQFLFLENYAHPDMMRHMREHIAMKADMMQMPPCKQRKRLRMKTTAAAYRSRPAAILHMHPRRRLRRKTAALAALPRPPFVQNTSLGAIQIISEEMGDALLNMGIQPGDFERQSRRRMCDGNNSYMFADFAFVEWAGLKVSVRPAPSHSDSDCGSCSDLTDGGSSGSLT